MYEILEFTKALKFPPKVAPAIIAKAGRELDEVSYS